MTKRVGRGGRCKNLRNRWYGSHAMPHRKNRTVKARLHGGFAAKDDYASTMVEGVVHHFIPEACRNIHRLHLPAPQTLAASFIAGGKRERNKERARKAGKRGRDI